MKKDKFITEFDDIPKSRIKMKELSVEERKTVFDEVELGFSEEEAVEEAKRCLSCRRCIGCGLCLAECEPRAVAFSQKPEEITIPADAVILAPGSEQFNPAGIKHLGYGDSYNVITTVELERLVSSSGPYGGYVLRPSDGELPGKIAFIQCVGSRNEELRANFCSETCCMTAVKQSIELKRKLKSPEIRIFYRDLRPVGKGSDEYFIKAEKEYGIELIRAEIKNISEDGKGNVEIDYICEGEKRNDRFDLCVLSTGHHAPGDGEKLCTMSGGTRNRYGFSLTDSFSPGFTGTKGIYTVGSFNGPKDIPACIAEADYIAGAVTVEYSGSSIVRGENLKPERGKYGGKTGLFLCKTGLDQLDKLERADLICQLDGLSEKLVVKKYDFACVKKSGDDIVGTIKDEQLDRVIICSCYGGNHSKMFRTMALDADLKPEFMEVLDTESIKGNVLSSLKKILEKQSDKNKKKSKQSFVRHCLIMGGGISGMTAALRLAELGIDVTLAEKSKMPGGRLKESHYLVAGDGINTEEKIKSVTEKLKKNEHVELLTNHTMEGVQGKPGNFTVTLKSAGKKKEIKTGSILIATGSSLYEPEEFLYGKHDRVINQFELEKWLSKNTFSSKEVVMIQCVGARNDKKVNCSRLCCAHALKNALRIKQVAPDSHITILHKGIRVYGFEEDLLTDALELGVNFITYDKVPGINDILHVNVFDVEKKKNVKLKPDLVVLSLAAVPNKDNKRISEMLNISLDGEGYFKEAHSRLRPVEVERRGIFVCGMAHYPKPLAECIAQAGAAAERAFLFLNNS